MYSLQQVEKDNVMYHAEIELRQGKSITFKTASPLKVLTVQ